MARKPRPARTDTPPMPNSRPSCRPAVPPPPVSGAAVGTNGDCVTVAWTVTVAVTVACGVDEARVERLGVADGEAAAGELGARVAEEETETETETETEAWAVDRPVEELLVLACVVAAEDPPPPAGDGVWVAGFVAEPDDDVNGVGVKVDGTEEPLGEQAETATVSRTAPAARRPAASHASRVAAGVVSRIFMDPPRTRQLHPLIRRARSGGRGAVLQELAALRIKNYPITERQSRTRAAKG